MARPQQHDSINKNRHESKSCHQAEQNDTRSTPNEQYFSAQPSTEDERKSLNITVRGHDYEVEVSNSVFSTHRLDLGTKVLLDRAPSPEAEDLSRTAQLLDLGCGWGPISLGLAAESPESATIWALDVNERAVELTQKNAQTAGFTNVRSGTVESFTHDFGTEWTTAEFDLIWSNPPIRIGKDALHELLMTYLPRLAHGGRAYLVVQKHLGADPLMSWLDDKLNDDDTDTDLANHTENTERNFTVSKYASAKGYRIIEVTRN